VILTYKRNPHGTLQAAHSGSVRIGYVENTASHRWIWSLNTIQPKGGRASGIEETEESAKDVLHIAWLKWLDAAGLTCKEQQDARSLPTDHADA
jgi:hypothetical protein